MIEPGGPDCRATFDAPSQAAATVQTPIIASGGANSAAHLAEALEHGASAVLAASIFHDGDMTVKDVKEQLRGMGVHVRL